MVNLCSSLGSWEAAIFYSVIVFTIAWVLSHRLLILFCMSSKWLHLS